jgi:phage terminase large subunit-like protein
LSRGIPIGASSAEQATILYTQAAGFVRRSGLEKRFRIYEYRRIGSIKQGGVRLRVYAADQRTADGAIPVPYAICDELHRSALSGYRTWKGELRKRGAQLVTIQRLASRAPSSKRTATVSGTTPRGGTSSVC